MSRRMLATLALLPFLAFAGCASDVPPTASEVSQGPQASDVPQVDQSATPSPDTGQARQYFEALASNDPEEMEGVKSTAAPGSVAAAYLLHLTTVDGADLDGGVTVEPDEFSEDNGTYESCTDNAEPGSPDCAKWADVKLVNGKVSSFTVNGVDIRKRLTLGSGDKVKAKSLGEVKFVSAYQSVNSKSLFVALEFKSNKRAVSLNTSSAKYRDPSGRQSTATSAGGPYDIDANSNARVYMVFKGAKPGGVVKFDVLNAKTYEGPSVKIKVG